MTTLACRLPCSRCSQLRPLRADDLCPPCGEGQDAARLKDWQKDHQAEFKAWAAKRMAKAS